MKLLALYLSSRRNTVNRRLQLRESLMPGGKHFGFTLR